MNSKSPHGEKMERFQDHCHLGQTLEEARMSEFVAQALFSAYVRNATATAKFPNGQSLISTKIGKNR